MKKKLFTSSKVLKSSLVPLVFVLFMFPGLKQCHQNDDDDDDDDDCYDCVTMLESNLENLDNNTYYL